jgi:hypothetical protein
MSDPVAEAVRGAAAVNCRGAARPSHIDIAIVAKFRQVAAAAGTPLLVGRIFARTPRMTQCR